MTFVVVAIGIGQQSLITTLSSILYDVNSLSKCNCNYMLLHAIARYCQRCLKRIVHRRCVSVADADVGDVSTPLMLFLLAYRLFTIAAALLLAYRLFTIAAIDAVTVG